jgi:hypothetical protein
MKLLVIQGFSRFLSSWLTCGYLSNSRQKCQKFARNDPQGYPRNFHRLIQERKQNESLPNRDPRCTKIYRCPPYDLRCVVEADVSGAEKGRRRDETQAVDLPAATGRHDSPHNQTPAPWTRADQFVDSDPLRLPQSSAASADSYVRAVAGRIPGAHHGRIDPILAGQPGGDRKVATAAFRDHDDQYRGPDLVSFSRMANANAMRGRL